MASKGKGARDKGANYERDIAKRFTSRFGIEVNRTGSQERWSYYGGDIHAAQGIDTVLNDFFFELKNRENLPKTIIKWLKKAQDDAEGSFKRPVVITTKNFEDDYIFMELDNFEDILYELEGYRKESE
jgi:Holliday junction resolvase